MLKKIFDILFSKRNQELISELENEKAIMELESYVSGKVVFTHALNQKIKPNTEICIIEGI